jgi:hypothetical protein
MRTGKCANHHLMRRARLLAHAIHSNSSLSILSTQHTCFSMADPAYSPPEEDSAADRLITLSLEDDEDE